MFNFLLNLYPTQQSGINGNLKKKKTRDNQIFYFITTFNKNKKNKMCFKFYRLLVAAEGSAMAEVVISQKNILIITYLLRQYINK